MQKLFFLSLFFGATLFSSCTNTNQSAESTEVTVAAASENAEVYLINAKTPIRWLGKKLTGEHYGTITTSGGKLLVQDGALSGGQFELDMNSITVLDLKDPDKNADLLDHLKSDDFFATATHPQGQFEITGVEAFTAPDEKGNTHFISGNLTLKGIVQGIRFPALVLLSEDKIQAKATFSIDRTLWDIRYRSGKFFPELGDKVINDQIGITLDVEATKG